MQYTHAKRYPVIGVRTVVPVTSVPKFNPVTGWTFDPLTATAVDKANGMEMTNRRAKRCIVILNTDVDGDLIVTPMVSAKVNTYDVDPEPITVEMDGGFKIIGPFSANFEFTGKIQFDFAGASTSALCAAVDMP